MEQLRQRVTAACHLGPLEKEETREYIQHRLKCAGSTDKPSLDPEIFDSIHRHTGGIPRRINNLFDRVLLQGFLAERTHIDLALVSEIIDEVQAEMRTPPKAIDAWNQPLDTALEADSMGGSARHTAALDLDLSLDLDAGLADSMAQQLNHIAAEQLSARLLRIEHSVLRQERVNLEILLHLQKLVASSRKPSASSAVGPERNSSP